MTLLVRALVIALALAFAFAAERFGRILLLAFVSGYRLVLNRPQAAYEAADMLSALAHHVPKLCGHLFRVLPNGHVEFYDAAGARELLACAEVGRSFVNVPGGLARISGRKVRVECFWARVRYRAYCRRFGLAPYEGVR